MHLLAHRGIYASALARTLCRWTRTTWSALSNAEHDAGRQEQGRAGGRAIFSGGGGGFEKGCFGVDWWAVYVDTYPRKGCVTVEHGKEQGLWL